MYIFMHLFIHNYLYLYIPTQNLHISHCSPPAQLPGRLPPLKRGVLGRSGGNSLKAERNMSEVAMDAPRPGRSGEGHRMSGWFRVRMVATQVGYGSY